jgi:aspartate racemase
MKTIGLIGGMSWESSIKYYQIINEKVREKFGGLTSAKVVLYSVNFADVAALQRAAKWKEATDLMIDAAHRVEKAGADFVLICTNTMHKMAPEVQASIKIPLLHIADATAQKVKGLGMRKVGLLGTTFTMEDDFYKGRLMRDHGLDVLIPNAEDRQAIHRVIFDELCVGEQNPKSRDTYITIMNHLANEGAEGIILGCTEIGLLIQNHHCRVPIFDTTIIHAETAVEWALA